MILWRNAICLVSCSHYASCGFYSSQSWRALQASKLLNLKSNNHLKTPLTHQKLSKRLKSWKSWTLKAQKRRAILSSLLRDSLPILKDWVKKLTVYVHVSLNLVRRIQSWTRIFKMLSRLRLQTRCVERVINHIISQDTVQDSITWTGESTSQE